MKCTKCKVEGADKFYNGKENRKSGLCKQCYLVYLREHRQYLKHKAIEYKGGRCQRCGYSKCRAALSFHHEKDKDRAISYLLSQSRRWSDIIRELDKCILLCCRCHAEVHHLDNEIREFEFEHNSVEGKYAERNSLQNIVCPICKKTFRPKKAKTKYCDTQCRDIGLRKIDRPNKAELEQLMQTDSMVSIGKRYKVSDNTIRKWAKKYGIL